MAISIVGGLAVGSASSTTITKPTGTAQNDLILIQIESSSSNLTANQFPTAPTGFTVIDQAYITGASSTTWAYKVAGASEPASWSWTQAPGANQFNVWACIVLRGQDATTAIDAHTSVSISSGTSLSLSALTASVAGDALVIFVNDVNDVDVSTWPTGVTENTSASNATGNGVMTGTELSLASGSTGALTTTMGATPGLTQAAAILVKAPASTTDLGSSTGAAISTGTSANLLTQLTPSATAAAKAPALTNWMGQMTPSGNAAAISTGATTVLAGMLSPSGVAAATATGGTVWMGQMTSAGTAAAIAASPPTDFLGQMPAQAGVAISTASSPTISLLLPLNPALVGAAISNSPTTTFQWINVFYDDFLGSSLSSEWNIHDDVGVPNETSLNAENPANVSVSNSEVHLVASSTPYRGMNYSGATVDTQRHFTARYGAITYRAKMATGQGIWPAVWATNEVQGTPSLWTNEIDVAEFNGGVPTQIHLTEILANGSSITSEQDLFYTSGSTNWATDFHVYRVEWFPGGAKFFVDGVLAFSPTIDEPEQFQLVMNVSVGGPFVGNTITTNLPTQMDVDYVIVEVPAANLLRSAALQPAPGATTSSTPALSIGQVQFSTSTAAAAATGTTALLLVAVPLTAGSGPALAASQTAALTVAVALSAQSGAALATSGSPPLFNGLLFGANPVAAIAASSAPGLMLSITLAPVVGAAQAQAPAVLLAVSLTLHSSGASALATATTVSILVGTGMWRWGLFTVKQALRMVFSVQQPLKMLFLRRAGLVTPNSTITVTMTAEDANGNPLTSGLVAVTCTVTFPDGSLTVFSLGSGISSLGSGQYALTYTTKGIGENVEDWAGTDGAGNRSEFHNITPVSF